MKRKLFLLLIICCFFSGIVFAKHLYKDKGYERHFKMKNRDNNYCMFYGDSFTPFHYNNIENKNEMYLEKLAIDFNLSDDQIDKIEQIFDKNEKQIKEKIENINKEIFEFKKQIYKEIDELNNEINEEIKLVLDNDQRIQFERQVDIKKRFKNKKNERRKSVKLEKNNKKLDKLKKISKI